MKKNSLISVFLVLYLFAAAAGFAQPKEIAKVDLGLVVSVHPQMSLFDFDRMGFFKIPLGLTREEFQMKREELMNLAVDQQLFSLRAEIEAEIRALNKKTAALHERLVGSSADMGRKIDAQLKEVSSLEETLKSRLYDIEYQLNCKDLTAPEKTRELLRGIENEIMGELKKLVAEKKYDLVFNSTITVPFNFQQRYQSGAMFGLGVPGIDFSLFYSFIANREHVLPSDETPESRNLINWLELIGYPDALNLLPLKPYPLVLAGGKDITAELVERIYEKHGIDEKISQSLLSILDIIRQHEKNFDNSLESLVAPK